MAQNVDGKTQLGEWLYPLLFVICAGWVVWHMPAFILDWANLPDQSAFDRLSAQYTRNDVTPDMGGVYGGFVDPIDLLTLIGIPVLGALGVRSVRRAHMEHYEWNVFDKITIFLGRVTMVLIVTLLSVMIYEVILRYIFERPTLWANELSLWIAGFVFLLAGLYAMQQRSHIRIFIAYDHMPRWLQKACDTLSTILIIAFAAGLIWGGFGEAKAQFFRWETLGTAFDPPIPATLTPSILIVVSLVTLQAVSNLIRDWNLEPEIHTAADEVDEEEIAAMKRAIGEDDNV